MITVVCPIYLQLHYENVFLHLKLIVTQHQNAKTTVRKNIRPRKPLFHNSKMYSKCVKTIFNKYGVLIPICWQAHVENVKV